MSFVQVLALAIVVLGVAPYVAHRLRRKKAEERGFAAAHLVDPAPPRARSRSKLEDRALFGARLAQVVGLAILGASPLIRSSRLSLARSSGASVAIAIVLDDSMSMRATLGGSTRFERARDGARQLLSGAREGDSVAVVLAGAPARVSLAATGDVSAARDAVDSATPSDRGTDLDGAIAMARSLLSELPQVDKRVVVLSDLADGHPDAPALGSEGGIPVWVPLAELREPATDCGILRADRSAGRIRVKVACSLGTPTLGREVAILEGDKVLAHGPLGVTKTEDVQLALSPEDAQRTDLVPLTARLSGSDSIAADDSAPVLVESGPGAVAVVAEPADEIAATGRAPVVEQALSALDLDLAPRPVPAVPDRVEDLAPFVGAILDDPPGLTPEERRAVASYVEGGGTLLVALGPRAARAPLGASFDPILPHAVTWTGTSSRGVDLGSAAGPLVESAPSALDLDARSRAVLAPGDADAFERLLAWSDGAPLVLRRTLGRGAVWVATLPFGVDASDLPLRPLFLALLDAWVNEAKARRSPTRGEAGAVWTFPGARSVEVMGPGGPLPVGREGTERRVVAPLLGLYRIEVDGNKEARVIGPRESEIELAPRKVADAAAGHRLGDAHATVDASPAVALALLAILGLELVLRARARTRDAPA